ncbi:MAG TPA: hypothetical protein VKE69_14235 [Planctomycetota bacterium]|nr:hypothetical protein [Planctomycetota bacterium]
MSARALAIALAAGGCAFTHASSDYFDSRGIETVAIVDDALAIAYSGPSLYVTDGTRVLRASADGDIGAPVEIARTSGEGIRGLSASGTGLVAWCDGVAGGAWYAAEGGASQRVPGSTTCDATAAAAGAVSYLSSDASDVTIRRFVIAGAKMDLDTRLAAAVTPARIWASADGVLVTTSDAGIIRTCLPGDTGCENGLCRMASVNARTIQTVTATGSGAAVRPFVISDLAEMFAPTSACCAFRDEACPGDAYRTRRTVFSGDAFAVLNGALLTLHASNVARVESVPDPTKDATVAPSSRSARLLAVSPTHAFFVDDRKIQRAPLALP